MARAADLGREEVRHLHRLARLSPLVLDDDLVAPQQDSEEPFSPEPDLEQWLSSLAADGSEDPKL